MNKDYTDTIASEQSERSNLWNCAACCEHRVAVRSNLKTAGLLRRYAPRNDVSVIDYNHCNHV